MSEEIRKFSQHTDAALRLYLTHWMFTSETGFYLHPAIPTNQAQGLKVIDVGCGTGLWLLDLAKKVPNAQLHGFDLSPAHFPPKDALPENITLWQQDALQAIPAALIGQYDVVHVSRFHMYIGDENLSTAIENFKSLLRPGGYIQWDELDVAGFHAARFGPSKPFPAFERLRNLTVDWLQAQRTTTAPLDDIPAALEPHGFKTHDFKRWEVSKAMSKPWTDMQLLGHRDYIENVVIPGLEKEGTESSVIEEWRSLRVKVEAEVGEQGLRILMDLVYTVAQRSE